MSEDDKKDDTLSISKKTPLAATDTYRIKDWVTPVVVGAYPNETVQAVAQRMQKYNIGAVIVNDPSDERPLGIFTERDILNKIVAEGKNPEEVIVKDVMTSPIETVNASSPPFEVFKMFAEKRFRHLPVTLDDGRIIGVLSMRSQGFIQEIVRIMHMLENVNEMKTRFLSNVSHELRTPLVSITKGAALLLDHRDDLSEEEKEKYLKIIEKQGMHLLYLIGDLLDMTALEAGKMKIERQHIDLTPVIEISMRNCELMASRKGIKLKFEKNIQNAFVFCDDNRIAQVLQNLISNAIKFTPEGGEIIISVQKEGDTSDTKSILVAVKDTGVGIREEKLRVIFERFEQAHDPQLGKPQGTGLGLSIVKEIVALHNGRVWVESEESKGSTFYFTIPSPDIVHT